MEINKQGAFKKNLNRLIIIVSAFMGLKLFTYMINEFLPVFGKVIGEVFSAILPFVIALIFAFLLEPLVLRLMKLFRVRRTYASVLALVISLIVIFFALLLIGSRLYRELAELLVAFPDFYDQIVVFVTDQIKLLEKYFELNPDFKYSIQSSTKDALGYLHIAVKEVSVGLLAILGVLPGFMVVIMVSFVATMLTSMSFPTVKEWFFKRFKGEYNTKSKIIFKDLGTAFIGFLRAETILVSVTAVVVVVGLLIIGQDYAFIIGILSGFLDLIPVIGPSLIFIPWIIVLLFTEGLAAAFKILCVYLVASIIRQMLEPKIMSQNIGMHPLPTLISMYAGLKIFGAVGLVIGPAVIVIYDIIRKVGISNKKGE